LIKREGFHPSHKREGEKRRANLTKRKP